MLAAPLARPAVARHARPGRPIRRLVAFAAGDAADTAARSIAADMQEALGQTIVIENRTGGNAVVAQAALLQAPRGGYTFLVASRTSSPTPPRCAASPSTAPSPSRRCRGSPPSRR